MNSVIHNILNFVGFSGSTRDTGPFTPKPRNAQQEIDIFGKNSAPANPNIWEDYNVVLRGPQTYDAALQLWNEMASWDLLAAALAAVVDEATQTDGISPSTLWYTCNDSDMEESLNDMLSDLDIEDMLPSQIWHVAAYGNNFERLTYDKGAGVQGMSFVHPFEMRRYWVESTRKCIGYHWNKHKPIKSVDVGYGVVPRSVIGGNEALELWYPWDFMHMRRMHKLRRSEHGEPLFSEADQIYKKLRMAIDQMVVHRAQVQPDRYTVEIDVKDQPPTEQMKTVQRWKQSFRSKISMGPAESPIGVPEQMKSFYNALSLDTILWIAKPREFQHAISKLAGTPNVPDVYDIELLTNMFFSIIGMPKSWIGLGADGGEGGPVSGKALLAQDMRFLRKIKSIRRPVITSYTWLGYFHALLKGKEPKNLTIKAEMPPIGTLEDQMKLEMLNVQADVMAKMGDVMEKFGLPKDAFVDVMFRKYLKLPDEVVNAFMTSLPEEPAPGASESKKNGYSMRVVMEDIVKKLGPEKDLLVKEIQRILDGKPPRAESRYRKVSDVVDMPISEAKSIVTGWGDSISEADAKKADAKKADTDASATCTQRLTESQGYRSAMNAHLKINS